LAQILAGETCDDGIDLRWQIRQIDDIERERHIGVSCGAARAGAQISQSIEVRCPTEAIPNSKPPIPAKSPATSIPKFSARVQTDFHAHILFTRKKVRYRAFPHEILCRIRARSSSRFARLVEGSQADDRFAGPRGQFL